jgi:hypothetical protein
MELQNSSEQQTAQKKSHRIAVFSTKNWVSNAFDDANKGFL